MTEIIRAEPGDAAVLGAVIAEAFVDLPPSRWLIGDETSRRKIFPAYFRIFVEHAPADGIVHSTPDREAAALWIPVGDGPPQPPRGYLERLRAVAMPLTAWFTEFDAALDSRHLAGAAHHYLALLAVWPERQGRGIGTALLRCLPSRPGPRWRCRVPGSFLPAQPPAVPAARDADHGAPICLPGGPPMFPMVRQPVSARPGSALGTGDGSPAGR